SVPPGDGLLADVPADLDLLAVPDAEEVDQPEVDVLDPHAERREPLDARARRLGQTDQLLLGCVQVARGVAAAVAADRGHELTLRALELSHALAQRDEPFGDGAHLLEGAVSLVGSE